MNADILDQIERLRRTTDTLACDLSILRDNVPPGNVSKADYRYVCSALDASIDQLDKAIRRLTK